MPHRSIYRPQDIKLQIIKEWIKEAYFKFETNVNYASLKENLSSLQHLILEHSSFQETLLDEAISLTENLGDTPRFLSANLLQTQKGMEFDQNSNNPFESCKLLIASLSEDINNLIDREHKIIEYYRAFAEKTQMGETVRKSIEDQVENLWQSPDKVIETGRSKENEWLKQRVLELENELKEMNLIIDEMIEEKAALKQQLEKPKIKDEFSCKKCSDLIDEVDDLKLEVESNRKQIKSLKVELLDSERELQKIYKEDSHKSSKDISNKEILKEIRQKDAIIQNLSEKLKETEISKNSLQKDVDNLRDLIEQQEGSFSDLLRQTRDEEEKTKMLEANLSANLEELRIKTSHLEKAQKMIIKLKDELDRMIEELQNAESKVEKLQNSVQELEEENVQLANHIEELKAAESKMQDITLQNNIESLKEVHWNEQQKLKRKISQLKEEKAGLELALEELEIKLKEIEKFSQKRAEIFNENCQIIQELENTIKEKEQIIKNLKDDNQTRDSELLALKHHAKNVLAHLLPKEEAEEDKIEEDLKTQIIYKRPSKIRHTRAASMENIEINNSVLESHTKEENKTEEKVKISEMNLIEELDRAFYREKKLKEVLLSFVNKEAENIKSSVVVASDKGDSIRAEIESWAMRCEEFKQKLSESEETVSVLMDIIKDYQRTIAAKEKLSIDKISNEREIQINLQSHLDFLQEEIKLLHAIIIDEIIPTSEKTFSSALSSAHMKLSSLKNYLRAHSLDPSYIRHSSVQVIQLKKDLEDARNDILEIYHVFSSKFKGSAISSLNGTRELLGEKLNKTEEITKMPIETSDLKREIITKIRGLKGEEEKNGELNQDIGNLHEKLRVLKESMGEREKLWNKEVFRLQEQIKQIKEIASEDNSEKIKLQNQLEEEVNYYKNQVAELNSYIYKLKDKNEIIQQLKMKDLKIQDLENELQNCSVTIINQKKEIEILGTYSKPEKEGSNSNRSFNEFLPPKLQYFHQRSLSNHSRRDLENLDNSQSNNYNKQIYELQDKISQLEQKLSYENSNVLQQELEKIKKKKETDKISFQKRVKEFELILRYLEERINKVTSHEESGKSTKMNSLIEQLSAKNPTFCSWINTLCSKLENYAISSENQAKREFNFYLEASKILSKISSMDYVSSQFHAITQDLVESGVLNLDSVSAKFLSGLRGCLLAVKPINSQEIIEKINSLYDLINGEDRHISEVYEKISNEKENQELNEIYNYSASALRRIMQEASTIVNILSQI
ncbi:unnamed protein product [Blepharisma stoltei]|uniref:Uncharacterized protein n=1 Tax=Blepharisma stoltei TaxID=1481888 RepID=A0AAU9JEA8_9CILI|nr:unnamed protein product [Blepharisma stoltei]